MIDEAIIKEEFPQDEDVVYLNHAAIAPWPMRTAAAVKKFAEENVTQGALNYRAWSAKEAQLRVQLKNLLNAPSADDIALLKNTSEALSIVACGIEWQAGENIVTSDEEFPSNRIPWQAQTQVKLKEINLNNHDPEQALMDACDKNTRLLTISSVQYGSGRRLDIEKLGIFCRDNDILFCVDAIQSIGAHNIDVQAINADFVMADGHKWMLGPEGLAVFYCRDGLRDKLKLYQYGWHMIDDPWNYDNKKWRICDTAKRFECGTTNMVCIHALSASLSLIEEIGIDNIEKSIHENTSYLIDHITGIRGVTLLTPAPERQRMGIATFRFAGKNMAEMHRELHENRIVCAYRHGGIRFSPHFYTSTTQMNKALEVINAIY